MPNAQKRKEVGASHNADKQCALAPKAVMLPDTLARVCEKMNTTPEDLEFAILYGDNAGALALSNIADTVLKKEEMESFECDGTRWTMMRFTPTTLEIEKNDFIATLVSEMQEEGLLAGYQITELNDGGLSLETEWGETIGEDYDPARNDFYGRMGNEFDEDLRYDEDSIGDRD